VRRITGTYQKGGGGGTPIFKKKVQAILSLPLFFIFWDQTHTTKKIGPPFISQSKNMPILHVLVKS